MGRGRDDDDDDDDEDEEDIEFVQFQGALNGNTPDLGAHARLVQAGLIPAKELVSEAIARRAEMVRLEPKGKVVAVTMFVDGVPFAPTRMSPQQARAISQVLKLLAGLDIKSQGKAQAGGISADYEGTPYEVRINAQPVQGDAERLIIRNQNLKETFNTPKELGITEDVVQKIRDISGEKKGLILAVGTPFSGVTSLCHAIVRGIDGYLYSVFSIADLEGREFNHVTLFETNPADTLEQTLARARRSDADIILVNPLKDKAMASTVLTNSKNMCFVSEMPAKDAGDGIVRLAELVGDKQLVAEQLKLVLCQKLIRKLCQKCRHAYRPNPKLLATVGLPPETRVLYRAPRPDEEEEDDEPECSRCGGIGFYGRTGLLEVIEVNDTIRSMILKGADAATIRAQARKDKMPTFQSDGIRLVVEGKTSLEELQRVFRSK